MLRRFLFTIGFCLLNIWSLSSQTWEQIKPEVAKVEYLLRNGKFDLADELASNCLVKIMEKGSPEDLYRTLCLVYNVKRGLEESDGVPRVYNFLNEYSKNFKKENQFFLDYFKIRSLREYYLDCYNSQDPWIKDKDEAFKYRVLSLIEQISVKTIRKRGYKKYALNEYPLVFTNVEETFEINRSIKDIILLELEEFYETALLMEQKDETLISINHNTRFSLTLEGDSQSPLSARLLEGLNNLYTGRLELLDYSDRSDLKAFYLTSKILKWGRVAAIEGLDPFVQKLIVGSDKVLSDFIQLEYAFFLYDQKLGTGLFNSKKQMLGFCEDLMNTYPRAHFLHNNSLLLKSKLERRQLDVEGLRTVFPYQEQIFSISSKNIDTIHYLVCPNPFGYKEDFQNLVKRKQIEALESITKSNFLSKGEIVVLASDTEELDQSELEIIGLDTGNYCVFFSSDDDVFRGDYTMFEFKVSRTGEIDLVSDLDTKISYEYLLNTFHEEGKGWKYVSNDSKMDSDSLLFFEVESLVLAKQDSLIMDVSVLNYKQDGSIAMLADKDIELLKYQKEKQEIVFLELLSDKNGQSKLPLNGGNGKFIPYQLMAKDTLWQSSLLGFNAWLNMHLPKAYQALDLLNEQSVLQLDTNTLTLRDTLMFSFEEKQFKPQRLIALIDGKFIDYIDRDNIEDWFFPVEGNIGLGYHVFEVFFVIESRPYSYQIGFEVLPTEIEIPLEVNIESDITNTEGLFISGIEGSGGNVLLVFAEKLSKGSIPTVIQPLYSKETLKPQGAYLKKSFFDKSLGLQFSGIDRSLYLRRAFTKEIKIIQYKANAFDYKVNYKGEFSSFKIVPSLEEGIQEGSDLFVNGIDVLEVYPLRGDIPDLKTISAVIPITDGGRFSHSLPVELDGTWEFKFIVIHEEGDFDAYYEIISLDN